MNAARTRAALARALASIYEAGLAAGLSVRGEVDEGEVVAAGEAYAAAELHVEAARVLRELETFHDLILVPRSLLPKLAEAIETSAARCEHAERLAVAVRAAIVDALATNYAEAALGRPTGDDN